MKESALYVLKDESAADEFRRLHPHVQELDSLISSAHSRFEEYRIKRPDSVLWTPLHLSPWLSDARTQVFVKMESEQVTNSFKVRGAVNRVQAAVTEGQCIVTASTGNHAMAVVHALRMNNAAGIIFLPSTAKEGKVEALKSSVAGSKVSIRFAGDDCLQAELSASEYARENSAVYVSPYNDILVVAGQGTIGVEILGTLPKLQSREGNTSAPKCCYVTVGGGGLITGVAACLKAREPGQWRVVGCLPHNSPVMYDCVRAGKVVSSNCLDTLSDGSAGDIEHGSITFEYCKVLVDAWALINEEDIAAAIRGMFLNHRKVIEGAAAVAVAGFQKDSAWREKNDCSTAVIVACGGNIDPDTFARIISGQ